MPLFIPKFADLTASVDLGHMARITVGGKDTSRFLPVAVASIDRVKKDEFFIAVRADDKVKITGTEKKTLTADKTEVETLGRRDRFVLTDDGRLDYQIDLLEKPLNPWIDLVIKCSPDLTFELQPEELTPDEIADGCMRDENRKGGYDIFCSKRNNEYQTGMVGWLERAWIEVVGTRQWTTQNVAVKNGSGQWRIDIPLDVYAAWPKDGVTVGPVLGYDTDPGSTWSTGATAIVALAQQTMPVDGNITSIQCWTTTNNVRLGIFDHNSGTGLPDASRGYAAAGVSSGGVATANFSDTLTSGNQYWPAVQLAATVRYATVAGVWNRRQNDGTTNWYDNFVDNGTSLLLDRRIGIWVNYDEAATGNRRRRTIICGGSR